MRGVIAIEQNGNSGDSSESLLKFKAEAHALKARAEHNE